MKIEVFELTQEDIDEALRKWDALPWWKRLYKQVISQTIGRWQERKIKRIIAEHGEEIARVIREYKGTPTCENTGNTLDMYSGTNGSYSWPDENSEYRSGY